MEAYTLLFITGVYNIGFTLLTVLVNMIPMDTIIYLIHNWCAWSENKLFTHNSIRKQIGTPQKQYVKYKHGRYILVIGFIVVENLALVHTIPHLDSR